METQPVNKTDATITGSMENSMLLRVLRLITTPPGTPAEWSQTPPTTTSVSPMTWAQCEYLDRFKDFSF